MSTLSEHPTMDNIPRVVARVQLFIRLSSQVTVVSLSLYNPNPKNS
jgi:hypothetical protein